MTMTVREALAQAVKICDEFGAQPKTKQRILALRDALPQEGKRYEMVGFEPGKDGRVVAECPKCHHLAPLILTREKFLAVLTGSAEPPASAPAKQEPAVPEGWKLVPMVPTNDMFEAGFAQREKQHAAEQIDDMRESVFNIYHAMLAAAPSPTGNEESNT